MLWRVRFTTVEEIAVGVSKEIVNEPDGVDEFVVTVVPREFAPWKKDPELS